jgi:hypothetical protein
VRVNATASAAWAIPKSVIHLPVVGDQDVGGLHVAVDDPLGSAAPKALVAAIRSAAASRHR